MIELAAFGRALPHRRFDIEALASEHGANAAALRKSPGIIERHYCTTETQVDLAIAAARRAMRDARLDAASLDLVISACGVSFQPLPSMAPLVMAGLGIPDGDCETMDVNTTCLGFCSALDLAEVMIAAGRHRRILIVSAERASRGLPWETDPETAALFGDGAAAVVLTAGATRIRARRFATFPSAWDACQIQSGGTRLDQRSDKSAFDAGCFFKMNGRDLFKVTAANLPAFVAGVLEDAGWAAGDVDLVVPHQASPLALKHMARACGFAPGQVLDFIEGHGNMIAASIPFGLSLASEQGRLHHGARVLILGTSAGVSFGALALEIGKTQE